MFTLKLHIFFSELICLTGYDRYPNQFYCYAVLHFLICILGKQTQPKVVSKKNTLFPLVARPANFRHTAVHTCLCMCVCVLNFYTTGHCISILNKFLVQDYSYFSQVNLKDIFHIPAANRRVQTLISNGIIDGKKIIRTIQLIIPLH